MTKRCLDEATLQAFMDGELEPSRAAAAASHLAACDECAAAHAAAEREGSLFALAFAPDETVAVPSEVLRSRIGAAVARLEAEGESVQRRPQERVAGGLFASLMGLFNFTPQGAAAFAGLLAVVALGAVYFAVQRSQQTTPAAREVAEVKTRPEGRPAETATPEPTPGVPPMSAESNVNGVQAPVVQVAGAAPRRPVRKSVKPPRPDDAPAPAEEALPGESEYKTAIASLEKTIKLGGDESLRPSVRADYERNLALLDSAISRTREVAAQNPKDKDAVSFLMSAYQSKVELLTRVADQAQVAALGR